MSLRFHRSFLCALLLLPPAGLAVLACNSATYGGSGGGSFPTPTGADVIMVHGAQNRTTTAFNPNPFNVSLGGGASVTVTFGNDDKVTHDVIEDGANPTFNSGHLGKGTIFSHDFTAGDYTYHCGIHPNMVGAIHVTP